MKDIQLKTVKQRAKSSAFWNLIEKLGIQLLSAAIGLIMTRMLLPSDYGIVAMLDIFIALGLLIADSGFGQGYIHRKNIDSNDSAILFTYNIGVALLLYACMSLAAPSIASFYNEPRLLPIIHVFSLNIPLQAAAIIPQSILMKELQLKTLTQIKLVGAIAAGVVGVLSSIHGMGAWAIVLYITSYNAFVAIALVLFSGWKPRLLFTLHRIRSYSQYSVGIFVTNSIDAMYTNFLTMFINKYYRASVGGLYTKARLLQNMPVQSTLQIIHNVSFPVLTKVTSDAQQFAAIFRRQAQIIAFLLSAIMGTMIIVARPFIAIILTSAWLPMTPYLQLLCILGWLLPFHFLHITVLNAFGRSDLSYRVEIVKKVVAFLVLGFTFTYGVIIIIWGQILVMLAGLLFHMIFSRKFLQVSLTAQLKDLFIPALIAAFCIGILELIFSSIHDMFDTFVVRTVLFWLAFYALTYFARCNQGKVLLDLLKTGMQKS